jgi:LCP family protein required for cell wall assembly
VTSDHTEQLIRDAFAAEADRAVDSRVVRAALERRRRPRRHPQALLTAAVAAAVMAVAVVVMPMALHRDAGPAATAPVEDENVLVAGRDSHGRLDSLLLTHLDTDGTAAAMSIPRDTGVRVDGRLTRLNQLADRSGMDALLSAVRTLTGVRVTHYVAMDMAGFADLADAVDGVPVCLLHPVSDPLSGVSLPAGRQVLKGAAALAFVRQRHGLANGDLDRIVRQQAFLRSMATKLRAADVSKLLDAVDEHVRTDPGLDLLGLAERLRGVRDVRLATAPIDRMSYSPAGSGTSYLLLDAGTVREFTAEFFAGTWQQPQLLPITPKPLPRGDVPCVS